MAYVGLADAYGVSTGYGVYTSLEAIPKAQEAAARALQLSPDLAEAHSSYAYVLAGQRRWTESENEFKRAIELKPGYANAHYFYALVVLIPEKRIDEAIREFKLALEIDPFSTIINTNYGYALAIAGRKQEELEQYRKTLEMDPGSQSAHLYLGIEYACEREYGKAVGELEKSDPRLKGVLDPSSKEAFVRSVIRADIDVTHVAATKPYDVGATYAMLGDKDKTFEWLERAYREQDPVMPSFIRSCRFDSIRSDARYADLMRRLGIPP